MKESKKEEPKKRKVDVLEEQVRKTPESKRNTDTDEFFRKLEEIIRNDSNRKEYEWTELCDWRIKGKYGEKKKEKKRKKEEEKVM